MGLSVNSDNTLALIGGEIALEGGVLNASSGHIELGSASNGTININTSTSIENFDYSNLKQFGDIKLSQQSLVDASGTPGGSINFQGRNISLNDVSAVLLFNQGNGSSGNLKVNASESLELQGVSVNGFPRSLFRTDNLDDGLGGNLIVSTPRISLRDGSSLQAVNSGAGAGGNIFLEVKDLLEIIGLSPTSGFASSVNANTAGSGKNGDIEVVASKLQILDGAVFNNSTSGTGIGGNVTINASDSIEISGDHPQNLAGSALTITTFGQGNAGKLTMNTPKLIVSNGAGLVGSTINDGNAGDLVINASEIVEVSGVGSNSRLPSRIGARAELLPEPIRQLFGLPNVVTGNTGTLTINTPHLEITDGAIVGVDHQGIGNAGNLNINTDAMLNRGGSIVATTMKGEGGNINLNVQDGLILRNGSKISSDAGGIGNGGNITINSPIIAGFENSDIIANAVLGSGGNIDISTQGIFGLVFRDELTPENDITASSQFGVNGTVNINNITIDPSSGLVELDVALAQESQQIATGCSTNADSSFVATGRGGIPQNPNENVNANRTWSDIRDLSAYRKGNSNISEITTNSNKPAIVEATGFIRNAEGVIELVALGNTPFTTKQVAECSGINT
ncbi:MAG: S-layer family protein [Rivularia sp. (in: cyanobacteria)]